MAKDIRAQAPSILAGVMEDLAFALAMHVLEKSICGAPTRRGTKCRRRAVGGRRCASHRKTRKKTETGS